MTKSPTRSGRVPTAVSAMVALGAGFAACEAELPDSSTTTSTNPHRVRQEPPAFTSYDSAPTLENPYDVQAQLREAFRERARGQDVDDGGVILWLHVSDNGTVLDSRITRESPSPALNRAAREIADSMTFNPAIYNGEKVSAWIQQRVALRGR